MKAFKSIISVIIVVILLVFVLQNGGELSKPAIFHLDLYIVNLSSGPLPLYSIILAIFILGLLISGVMGWATRIRLRSENKRLNRLYLEKDREVNDLRNLPVTEDESGDKDALPSSSGK